MYSQVLSTSVADAFSYFGDPSTTETETFIRYFDRLFDCLNVRNLSDRLQVHKKEKSNCKLMLIVCMWWLSHDFLSYLDNWQASLVACTDVTAEAKKRCF